MSWGEDVYHNPKKHGLEIVAEFEEPDLSWEFNMFVVWKDKAGNWFYDTDSGCSCPSPFEGVTTVAALTPANITELYDAVVRWRGAQNFPIQGFLQELNRKWREQHDKRKM